ncbi:hypothetical protein F7725_023262 [Dissostichus mawsoni]|uniref:Uncharacterized protein n=1 Tax=Dissostichus mawsoni TaxID=36200 RepID=A0A7J5Z333_DISMA|nr:hypothetical protein F7725_023262 [Dissostichus mawsoni]
MVDVCRIFWNDIFFFYSKWHITRTTFPANVYSSGEMQLSVSGWSGRMYAPPPPPPLITGSNQDASVLHRLGNNCICTGCWFIRLSNLTHTHTHRIKSRGMTKELETHLTPRHNTLQERGDISIVVNDELHVLTHNADGDILKDREVLLAGEGFSESTEAMLHQRTSPCISPGRCGQTESELRWTSLCSRSLEDVRAHVLGEEKPRGGAKDLLLMGSQLRLGSLQRHEDIRI